MDGVLVILDGLGDRSSSKLDNKSPLEAANTPNLDWFASHSSLGLMFPVKKNFVPESDEAIVSIFGNDLISSSRGQLETRGTNLKLNRGDLALRTNFATIDSLEKGNVKSRRAGRTLTTEEAKSLAKALNKIKLSTDFVFESTIQHRGVLVFRGGFSDNISGNDTTYFQGKVGDVKKVTSCKPLDDEENSQYTANVVNEFLKKAYEVLENHPVNVARVKKGLLPANYLLVRGPGVEIPKLKKYKNWMSVAYMPLERGFSKVCEMKNFSFTYPKLKTLDVYENLWKSLKKACKYSIKYLKKNRKKFDYAYIHIKETDLPGHDGKAFEKKLMIEYLDINLFKFLRKWTSKYKIKLVVTADHSTPCVLKKHSADPVPVLFYEGNSNKKEKRFTEKDCKKGSLGTFIGKDLFGIVGFK